MGDGGFASTYSSIQSVVDFLKEKLNVSKPPKGKKKVVNIWYDQDTGELVFDVEE